MSDAIRPPAMIGMLGGGQLGRYALAAARQMGYRSAVLDPSPEAPAGAIADIHLVAAYDDPDALDELARTCAVVTTEFENPPAAALEQLAGRTLVAPGPNAVATAQDRIVEKAFFLDAGVAVGPHRPVVDAADLEPAAAAVGFPAVIKTARMGYDGKGQIRVGSRAELERAWRELGGVPCMVEALLPLDAEVSAIVVRSADGDLQVYPVGDNQHADGILDITVVPARVADGVAARAVEQAAAIATALDYVGTLGVEFFVVGDELYVNEMAPRPHNSGHWTLDGAAVDQFEQQIRAICGLPLGDTSMRFGAVAMANLLGDVWSNGEPAWERAIGTRRALHLYGKSEARPGRKMGHLTVWGDNPDDVERAARAARRQLTRR